MLSRAICTAAVRTGVVRDEWHVKDVLLSGPIRVAPPSVGAHRGRFAGRGRAPLTSFSAIGELLEFDGSFAATGSGVDQRAPEVARGEK